MWSSLVASQVRSGPAAASFEGSHLAWRVTKARHKKSDPYYLASGTLDLKSLRWQAWSRYYEDVLTLAESLLLEVISMFLAPIPQREKPQPSALCTSTAVELLASSPRKRCFSGIFCGAMFAMS